MNRETLIGAGKWTLERFLENTMREYHKTERTVRLILRVCDIVSVLWQIFTVIYLLYATLNGIGYIYVNIALLIFSVSYLTFNITVRILKDKLKRDKLIRARTKKAKRVYRAVKIALGVVKCGISIYGVCISWSSASVIAVVLAVFNVIGLLIDIALEAIYYVFNSKLKCFKAALAADRAAFTSKLKETAVDGARRLAVGAAQGIANIAVSRLTGTRIFRGWLPVAVESAGRGILSKAFLNLKKRGAKKKAINKFKNLRRAPGARPVKVTAKK